MQVKRVLPIALAMLLACSGGEAEQTTTSVPPSTTSTTNATTTTTPVECPPPPYELGFLPVGVGANLDVEDIEPDVWTSVPGISATLWGREEGTVAMALIRGALPAVEWPGDRGKVSIDGTAGVAGPHPDGTWVVGWFEEPGDRCDLYTLVVYPPVSPDEVRQVVEGMNRVGG